MFEFSKSVLIVQRPKSQSFVRYLLWMLALGNGDAMLLTVSVSINPFSYAPQLSDHVPNNTIIITSRDVLALNVQPNDDQK